MKTILIATALFALSACGGSSTPVTKTDAPAPKVTIPDSVISGDIKLTDNGEDILTGSVSLTENATFIAQKNTETPLGTFSITTGGAWQFAPNRKATGLIELTSEQSITETIIIQTSDSQNKTITISLVGINDLPVFDNGDNIDSAIIYTNNIQEVTGLLTISDPDANESILLAQQATQGQFGLFSITDEGQWTYRYTDESLNYFSTQDVFTVTSLDGTEYPVTIFITPVAEIEVESSTPITGTLKTNDNSFIAQTNTQGAFGTFSINSLGEWSYSTTNLASDFLSPIEVFSVKKNDATEYKVAILVKGLYQRLVSEKVVEGSYNDAPYYDIQDPISIENLLDADFIINVQDIYSQHDTLAHISNTIIYAYDESGNLQSSKEYSYVGSSPNVVSNWEYKYSNKLLTRAVKTTLTYLFDPDFWPDIEAEVIKTNTHSYNIVDNRKTNSSIYYTNYGNADDRSEVTYTLDTHYSDEYNEVGKLSTVYKSYIDTNLTEIEAQFEGPRLFYEYFYNDDGSLNYSYYYKVHSRVMYEGLSRKSSFYYTMQNRLSHIVNRYHSYDYSGDDPNLRIYDPLDYSKSASFYGYSDEIDTLVTFSLYDEQGKYNDVYTATIYQYEDTDSCGDAELLINTTESPNLPFCKLKVANASSTLEDLPSMQMLED